MERFFLNLKIERVWQRDYANHSEGKRDITEYIVSSIILSGFTRNCAICCLPLTNGRWQQHHLSRCLKLFDRYNHSGGGKSPAGMPAIWAHMLRDNCSNFELFQALSVI
ncbi:hypothetical protein SAMN05216420_10933 [Nitrosospira sp. Nl5]|nr:hypothetical protein SAMN05216420_10933 [Nitrosospira sp. Nl5]